MSKKQDSVVGQRFGRLVVTAEAERYYRYSPAEGRTKVERRVHVLCECGNEKVVRLRNLRSGQTKGCGCGQVLVMKARVGDLNPVKTHGMTHTPEYDSWRGMLRRCNNANDPQYPLYGGRGIKVCSDWRKFENFFADMGFRPDGTSLDRIDVNGNYEPDNCRWADRVVQRHNQRDGFKPILDADKVREIRARAEAGETHQSLANEFGVCRQNIGDVVNRNTWKHVA